MAISTAIANMLNKSMRAAQEASLGTVIQELQTTEDIVDALSATEVSFIDGVTAGTAAASKAVVLDANKDIATIRNITINGNLVTGSTTLSEADLGLVDGLTAGTLTASKAVAVGSGKQINEWFVTATSASTDGGTSAEGMVYSMTMTGAGGVGGRARFQLDTNVVLGGWANALKGNTVFGATGAVTGLASAVLGEMTLSAGTTAGTYAPIEAELNVPSGAAIGTQSAFLYASVNGDDASTFDAGGFALSFNGLSIGAGNVIQAAAVSDIDSTHALKIAINGTPYFIPLHTSATFAS